MRLYALIGGPDAGEEVIWLGPLMTYENGQYRYDATEGAYLWTAGFRIPEPTRTFPIVGGPFDGTTLNTFETNAYIPVKGNVFANHTLKWDSARGYHYAYLGLEQEWPS